MRRGRVFAGAMPKAGALQHQISLKCRLKRTSSDKVMPFLCPSPVLKITVCCGAKADGRADSTAAVMKTANRRGGKRNNLEAAGRACSKYVRQILNQQVLKRSADVHVS